MAKEGYPLSLQVQPRYGKSAKGGAPRRKRSEFPSGAAGRRVCIGSDSRGRNSVRSEGALGRRTWPVAYRRDLRRLKKCPLKNFEFPPTQEPISSKPSRPNQSLQRGQPVIHRGFTGPTHSHGDGMDTHERIANTQVATANGYPASPSTYTATTCSTRTAYPYTTRNAHRPPPAASSAGEAALCLLPAAPRRWGIHTPKCPRTDRHLTNQAA